MRKPRQWLRSPQEDSFANETLQSFKQGSSTVESGRKSDYREGSQKKLAIKVGKPPKSVHFPSEVDRCLQGAEMRRKEVQRLSEKTVISPNYRPLLAKGKASRDRKEVSFNSPHNVSGIK